MALRFVLAGLLVAASAAGQEVQGTQAQVVAVLQEYGSALGKLRAETLGVPTFAKICAGIDPQGRDEFISHIAAWEKRNQTVMDEIQRSLDAFRKLDGKAAGKWDEMLVSQRASIEKQLLEELLAKSPLEARLACRKISEVVAVGDLRLKFPKELAVIRSFPVSLEEALK